MIVLRGLLENVLGNYPCIRGYATLGDLAKISKTDESFQRDIIPEHKEAITSFYEVGKNVFFSEIILALNINNGNVNFTHDSMSQDILVKNPEIKGAMIELNANQSKPMDQTTDNPKVLRNVALRLNTDFLLQNKPFVRIDGNHRLQAAEDSNESNLNKMCPFCIILFSYDNSSDDLNLDSNIQSIEKVQQSIIFHNINSKGRSLTSEEALKGIFDASRYEDDDLKADMGWEYVFARKIHNNLSFDHLQDIKKVFESKERSTLVELIKFLNEEELIEPEQESLTLFNNCIASAAQIYRDNSNLSDDKTIFIAIFYYIYREFKGYPERLSSNLKIAYGFVNWLIHNHMCNAVLEHPKEIVKIYNNLHDNEVKIFMAAPYYDPSIIADYNYALDESVKDIKASNPHINLINYTVMNNNSPTHNIVVDIFEKIDNCKIFIADITNNNANVLYEYGYAKGRDKPCILLLNSDKKDEDVKSDYGLDLRFEFSGHVGLKSNLREQLLSTLESLGYVLNS